MKRLFAALVLSFLMLLSGFSPVIAYAGSNKVIDKISVVNNYLKEKYDKENLSTYKLTDVKDKDGNTIVKYNYSGTVLMTSIYKIGDEWITVAHNGYGFPFIAVNGLYEDEDLGETVKRLSNVFDEIFNGKYDFSQNKANVAWYYMDGTDYEKLDADKLKAITANAAATDTFLKEAFSVYYSRMKIVPYAVIGYDKTPDPGDGNRIYACTAQTYYMGMYYKSSSNTYTKTYDFKCSLPDNSSSKSTIKKNAVTVTIEGKNVKFDTAPVLKGNVIMAPYKKVFEILGAKANLDSKANAINVIKGKTTIVINVGSNKALVNGKAKNMEANAASISGTIMVPAKFAAESLGYKYAWNSSTNTAAITKK